MADAERARPSLVFSPVPGKPMLHNHFVRRRSFRRRRGNLFTHRVWPLAMVVGGLLAAVIFVFKRW
jgi:hypothetical protein